MNVIFKEVHSLKVFKGLIEGSAADSKKVQEYGVRGVRLTQTPAERIALLDDAVIVFELFKGFGSPNGVHYAKSLPTDEVKEYIYLAEKITSGINTFLAQEDDPKTLFAAVKIEIEKSHEDGTSSELVFALPRNIVLEGEDGFHVFLKNVESFKKTFAMN